MNTKVNLPIYTEQQVKAIVRSIIESKDSNIYNEVVQVFEKPLIEELLIQERGNQTRVALRLGLNRGTLRKKLYTHGILNEEISNG
jgi:Fis family transcriptional regulator